MLKGGAAVFSEQPDGSVKEIKTPFQAGGKVEDLDVEDFCVGAISEGIDALLQETPKEEDLRHVGSVDCEVVKRRWVKTQEENIKVPGGMDDPENVAEGVKAISKMLEGQGKCLQSATIHSTGGGPCPPELEHLQKALNKMADEQQEADARPLYEAGDCLRVGLTKSIMGRWMEDEGNECDVRAVKSGAHLTPRLLTKNWANKCVLCNGICPENHPGRNAPYPIIQMKEGEDTLISCDKCQGEVVGWRMNFPNAEQRADYYYKMWMRDRRALMVNHAMMRDWTNADVSEITRLNEVAQMGRGLLDNAVRFATEYKDKIEQLEKQLVSLRDVVKAEVKERDTKTLLSQTRKIETLKKEIANRDKFIKNTKWATALLKTKPRVVWKHHMEGVCRDINNSFLTGKTWSYHRCALMDNKYYQLPQVAKDEFIAAKPPVRKPRVSRVKKAVEEHPCILCDKRLTKKQMVERNGDLFCKRCA